MASRCCFIISLLLFQIWFRAEAGTIDPRLADYSRVDALMTAPFAGKFRNIDSLSTYISKNFNAEHLRLRAAFRWVTHHIAYSFEYRSMTVQHVFKNRKAVCSGYAELMYELCRRTQVECRVVNGIAKNDDTFLDAPRESYGHAWNIVTLGGTDYLLDATWAAGYYDTRRHDFTRDFKDSYYLTDPTLFALQHLPDDPADQLLENPISYKHFEDMPAYTSQAVSLKIREMSPSTGELKSRRSDIIPFSIKADAPIENVVIGYRQPGSWYMKYHYPEIKQDGATSSFSVAIEEPGQYIMTVFVNHAGALYYKVKVGWK